LPDEITVLVGGRIGEENERCAEIALPKWGRAE
jgi:hypothetical protein